MKLSWVLVQCPRKVGSWPLTLLQLARGGELFLAGKLIVDAEQSWPEGRDDACKMKLFFLPFLCSSSQIFCSAVLLTLRKQTLELSQRYFF